MKQNKETGLKNFFYEYEDELYPEYLNTGNAMSFILKKAQEFCKGEGLDIGASSWPFPGAIPIQEEEGLNAYKLDRFRDESFDYIFSSHCLEHLEAWQEALGIWLKKIKIGGVLFLYLPHKSMKLWRPTAPFGGHHKWVPRHEILNKFLARNGCEILDFNAERDDYWSFYIAAKKQKHGEVFRFH